MATSASHDLDVDRETSAALPMQWAGTRMVTGARAFRVVKKPGSGELGVVLQQRGWAIASAGFRPMQEPSRCALARLEDCV